MGAATEEAVLADELAKAAEASVTPRAAMRRCGVITAIARWN
jgi:hypothetical protein